MVLGVHRLYDELAVFAIDGRVGVVGLGPHHILVASSVYVHVLWQQFLYSLSDLETLFGQIYHYIRCVLVILV